MFKRTKAIILSLDKCHDHSPLVPSVFDANYGDMKHLE